MVHHLHINHERRLLPRAVDVRPVSHSDGREAGALLAEAGTTDPIDATVVLLAAPGDRILTSDPEDLSQLAAAARNHAVMSPLDNAYCQRHSGRCVPCPGCEGRGPSYGGLGFGLAGLRRRRIRNPGSLLSLS